jgi:hypothetical protein
MANSYDRRINLYLNGKEVQNNLASIQKAMYKSTNELRRMTIGTDEYNKKAAEVKKLKQIFNDHQQQLRATVSPLQKLTEFAKGLLPAFSFAAIAAGAKKAFTQVINSTDTLSTKWNIFMGGMREATNEFWRTLATGDWSNFFTNMSNAIAVGREYEAMLDSIEAKQRALTIAEADAREEIVKLEEDLRNTGLSNEQRLAAGKRRIEIEEELAKNRAKIAQQEYDNELMMAKQASKLSDIKLQQLVRDLDSEKKIKAEAFNALQDELKTLEAKAAQKGASTGVLYPGMTTNSGYSASIDEIKKQMSGFSPEVVSYAGDLRLLGNVTDEQLNKMVAAYEKLKGAEVSGREGIKRVITMVNSLNAENKPNSKIRAKEVELEEAKKMPESTDEEIAVRNKKIESIGREIAALKELGTTKQGDTGEKESDKAIKKRIEEIDAADNAELVAIKKRHLEGLTSEDQYKGELLSQELKFLAEKLTVYKVGSKEYEETRAQFLEKQVTAEQTVKDLLLKAQAELSDAKIENLQDGIEKEKAIEEQRWNTELEALKERIIDKQDLSDQEIALNDTLNQTIEERKAAHIKKMADLDSAEELRKKQKIADNFGNVSQLDNEIPFVSINLLEEYFANRKSLLDQQYEYEVQLAGDSIEKKLAAEEKYNERVNKLNENQAEAYTQMVSRKIEIGQSYLSALRGLVGEETRLSKALFLFSQALSVAQIWVKTAATNAAIYSQALVEFALLGPAAPAAAAAWSAAPIAANNMNAALQTGLILAQTIAGFAEGKYPDTEFAGKPKTGMYGSKPQLGIFNEVPGQPEMVIDGKTNRKLSRNYPEIQEAIYAIRDGREPGSIEPSVNASEIGKNPHLDSRERMTEKRISGPSKAAVKYFAKGYYPFNKKLNSQVSNSEHVTPAASNSGSGTPAAVGYDSQLLQELAVAVNNLSKNVEYQAKNPPRPVVAVETIEKERKKYIEVQQTRGL